MLGLTKSEIRILYKKKRATLSNDEVVFLSKAIFSRLLQNVDFSNVKTLHCFLPIVSQKEIDTSSIIDYCFEHNIRVFVPKVVGEEMISVEINRDTIFVENKWGIKEPIIDVNKTDETLRFDICITPLLYADDNGNRVGYGKGFYDRFFAENVVVKKIGINYFEIEESVLDYCKTDMKLDFLVTPQRFYEY